MRQYPLRLFIQGRIGVLSRIKAACGRESGIIWFYVSSLGEFEEARPIIEATRARFPERKILLTVFSPRVWQLAKEYRHVDWTFFMPPDTLLNVRRFLDAVRPEKAIFRSISLRPFLQHELKRRKIATYPLSDQLVGDARVDRAVTVAAKPWSNRIVDAWRDGQKVFVAGSTHPVEDWMIVRIANTHPECKILITPFEPDKDEVNAILTQAQNGAALYSSYKGKAADDALLGAQILVIDTVGLLSRVYRYGFAAYVGGGFTEEMPHSVVEPASYGIPVAFGPHYEREMHCRELAELEAGFPVTNLQELEFFYEKSVGDRRFLERTGRIAQDYCSKASGATAAFMGLLFPSTD